MWRRVGKEIREKRGEARNGGERKKQSCQHNQLIVAYAQTVQVQMTLEGGRREKGGRRGKRKEGVGRETKDQSGRRGPTCSMMMSLSNMTSLL